ncbi:MAG TPA: response regulator [Actinomycetota bacterium]|jgi:DNA-binding NarL/FixJ family response regulator/class 3 adenylate cyclase
MSERTGLKTFLIADVRGYSLFTAEQGDQASAALVEWFSSVTKEVVGARDGIVVEFRGDEALAVFDSPRAAIHAAMDLQAAYLANDEVAIPVGIGLDAGEAVPVEQGFLGGAINVASRLCGLASAGEVLATGELTHLAGPTDGVTFEDRGEVRVKNVPHPIRLIGIVPDGDDPANVWRRTASTTPRAIRTVLADDSALFREGVARLLADKGFLMVGQAADAEELIEMVGTTSPDVVVTDIRMPPSHTTEGLAAARRIREEHPGVGVLVLSQYVEARHAIQLLRDAPEGVGYLLKDRVSDIGEFVDSVRRVARGGSAIDPEVVAHLLNRHGEGSELAALTGREREIIALMAEGRSNQAISERLFLSPKTVETHVGAIFSKLGLFPGADDHRRVLAVLMFLRNT